jgi:hypothetical protein
MEKKLNLPHRRPDLFQIRGCLLSFVFLDDYDYQDGNAVLLSKWC